MRALLGVLHAMGFYGARVTPRIKEAGERYEVVFEVASGPPYLMRDISVQIPEPAHLGLRRGTVAEGEVVEAPVGRMER